MQRALAVLALASLASAQTLRPPAVPLVVHDPYFSLWSPYDRPTDGWPTHWTGREVPLAALVRIDGTRVRRLLGPEPADVPALELASVRVDFTTTTYTFSDEALELTMSFVTPALPYDLDVLALPLTYLEFQARSKDGASHGLDFHVDLAARVAVNEPTQEVRGELVRVEGLETVEMGSVEQPVLEKRGDDLRIDWGHAYVAARSGPGVRGNYGPAAELRQAFVEHRIARLETDATAARRADDGWPAAAIVLEGAKGTPFLTANQAQAASARVMLAYDDGVSIRYFEEDLRPYWRRDGSTGREWLATADADGPVRIGRARAFDAELASDLRKLGSEEWVQLCQLAYRQALGANKLCADANGRPLLFPKENFSNGCIATVDVIYPMAPLFLLLSPDLAKAMLVPVLDYAASPRWKFPFAPHDLGTYPHATGQVYGGGETGIENQMPVEESANLILLVAAICERDGRVEFASKYWKQLTTWARYLEEKGFDPENQLCTDDFTGHLAHNVNLSAKATLALGAHARLARKFGAQQRADELELKAHTWAAEWQHAASEAESTKLAFDRPGTWSQKYNLVWDDVLALGLFPPEVKLMEARWYRKVQNAYGLPLDSRATFTKSDWTLWSACLGGDREDFDALVKPIHAYVNSTTDRVPLCDWSDTLTARKVNMIARPVVGGFFLRALLDADTWKKWYSRGARGPLNWAPAPILTFDTLVPDARSAPSAWRWTTDAPAADWFSPDFADSSWKLSNGGFGSPGTPGAVLGTEWTAPDLWLRRSFDLAAVPAGIVRLSIHHDEDADVYLNGILAAHLRGYTTSYVTVPLSPEARASLRTGRNTLALHCSQSSGGQYIDCGLVTLTAK
jgi:hypothetical protein